MTSITKPARAIPAKVRRILYLLWAVGEPVCLYLQAKGYLGTAELTLWHGIGAALGVVAASNVPGDDEPQPWTPVHQSH